MRRPVCAPGDRACWPPRARVERVHEFGPFVHVDLDLVRRLRAWWTGHGLPDGCISSLPNSLIPRSRVPLSRSHWIAAWSYPRSARRVEPRVASSERICIQITAPRSRRGARRIRREASVREISILISMSRLGVDESKQRRRPADLRPTVRKADPGRCFEAAADRRIARVIVEIADGPRVALTADEDGRVAQALLCRVIRRIGPMHASGYAWYHVSMQASYPHWLERGAGGACDDSVERIDMRDWTRRERGGEHLRTGGK